MARIKISVPITIEIDADDWTFEYGRMPISEVRDDVKSYVQSLVQESYAFGEACDDAKVVVR